MNSRYNKVALLVICLMMLFVVNGFSDITDLYMIDNVEFVKTNGIWYVNDKYKSMVLNDKMIVKFKENISYKEINELNKLIGTRIQKKTRYGFHIVYLPDNGDPIEIAKRYYASGIVEFAHPNISYFTLFTPSDAYIDSCYNLNQASDDDIDALEGWQIETGDSTIVIGVIDTGFRLDHPDLENRMNSGYQFTYETADTDTIEIEPRHGTKVAGVAAAEMNNNIGVASVAGGESEHTGVRIMPLACGVEGFFGLISGSANVNLAIAYAVDNGADVINMSFGSSEGSTYDNITVKNALDDAYDNNIVLVAASGNDGEDGVLYPAAIAHVISVGASLGNVRTTCSNYGDSLDVVAPSGSSFANTQVYTTNTGQGDTLYYRTFQTSPAAPQVAGLAALLRSFDSSLTAEEVYELICTSTDKIGSYNYSTVGHKPYGEWNNEMGYGRINVFKALYRAKGYGEILTDVTWYEDIEITGDVVVPNGVTLTIVSDVEVKFATSQSGSNQGIYASECEIVVESGGELALCTGTTLTSAAGSPAAGDWGCVYVKAGGTLDMQGNNTIEYATTGLYTKSDNGEGAASGSIIRYCSNAGVYVYSCDPSLSYLTLTNCGVAGIKSSGPSANPFIHDVHINGSDTDYGVFANSYGDANLDYSNLGTSIQDYRVKIDPYGDIDMDGGHNDIDVISGSPGVYVYPDGGLAPNISITHNWWGAVQPTLDSTKVTDTWSKITAWKPVDTSYNGGPGKIAAPIAVYSINPLREGYDWEKYGNIQKALNVYNKVISDYDDPTLKRRAVKSIYRVLRQNKMNFDELRTTIENELPKAEGTYKDILDYLLCDILLREGKPQEAVAAFSEKAMDYAGTMMGVEMVTAISNIYCDYLDDTTRAKEYADRAAAINPGHPTLDLVYGQLDIEYDPAEYKNVFEDGSEFAKPAPDEPDTTLEEFVEVAPNPFNPVTTITYSIAQPSYVTLDVYNITGQKVATLVDGTVIAGKHTAMFDGSNLASGMYFYRFDSAGMRKTGKMMLVK